MRDKAKTDFSNISLLLQGGGALGAYQAGVFEALSEARLEPNWVAGVSIGAINAAIISGNPTEKRVERLREFWETITLQELALFPKALTQLVTANTPQHQALNRIAAMHALLLGIPHFFRPRPVVPWLEPQGAQTAISFYDTVPLKDTLERLVDFDRINHGDVRLTLGAVDVTHGDFTYFDSTKQKIAPEHVMASGALPPGFPPVGIGGRYYWDGGLISNTPLQWILEINDKLDMLVFQIDLWSPQGEFPQNMAEVLTRHKDIQYSSRTRSNTDRFKEQHRLRHAIAALLDRLPDDLKQLPEAQFLDKYSDARTYNIIHLTYHNKPYEGYSKDFEFSRLSMRAHWKSGYDDTIKALRHPEILKRPQNEEGIKIFDFGREDEQSRPRREVPAKAAS